MAIEVQHQPVGAIYGLATQAGQAQAAQQQQEQRDRIQLKGMEEQMRMREMQFREKALAAARQEEMQYQAMLMMAKRQIDLQTEQAQYARQKQMLTQSLNMITESNEFSEKQKEELRVQAMAKYAGVGTGISPSSFDSGGMEKMLTQGAYKSQMLTQWQNDVLEGRMGVEDAERLAVGMGMSGAKFHTASETADLPYKAVRNKIDDINSSMSKLGISVDKKGKYYKDDYPVSEDDPLVRQYKALEREAEKQTNELLKLQGEYEATDEQGKPLTMEEFLDQKVVGDENLQRAVQLYGVKNTYDSYMKLTGTK
jgi:molybdenum-dependent DNA-binding transcriptional regulator ModE